MGSCSAIRKRPVQCLQAHCSSCASLCSACSQAVPAGSRAVSAVTLFHLKAGQSLNPSKIFSAASPPTAVLDICVKNFQNAAACALAGLLVFQTERAERRKPFLGPARPRSKQFPSKQNAVHFSAAIFARPRLSTPARNPREREREREKEQEDEKSIVKIGELQYKSSTLWQGGNAAQILPGSFSSGPARPRRAGRLFADLCTQTARFEDFGLRRVCVLHVLFSRWAFRAGRA